MKSARVVAYWYATAIVLVASSLMRGISTPHMFPWWFVGAEFGGGIVFGVLAWWLGRGASAARVLLLVVGTVVVLGAAALFVTGRGYEFAAVPAVLGVIATATGGELRGRTQQSSVPAVGDWTPAAAPRPAGPQPFGPRPAQPWGASQGGPAQAQPPWPGPDGAQSEPVPPSGTRSPWQPAPQGYPATTPPQHATQPQWHDPRSVPPQHPTLPPQHGTYPSGPAPRHGPPPGAGVDPSWRRVPGPSIPAPRDEGSAPARPPERPDGDAGASSRARHAAQPAPEAGPRPAADPEVQWAPRRRRHARPEQSGENVDPSHQEPEEN